MNWGKRQGCKASTREHFFSGVSCRKRETARKSVHMGKFYWWISSWSKRTHRRSHRSGFGDAYAFKQLRYIPVQSFGRTTIVNKFHLVQLPLFQFT